LFWLEYRFLVGDENDGLALSPKFLVTGLL
jgi:hypothetical protein